MNFNNNDDNGQNNTKFNFTNNRAALFIIIAILVLFIIFYLSDGAKGLQEISYSDFIDKVETGKITSVSIVDNRRIEGNLDGDLESGFWTRIPYPDEDLMPFLSKKNVEIRGEKEAPSILNIIFAGIPYILILAFMWVMIKQLQGGGSKAFSFGRSKAKRFTDKGKKTTFADVAGQKEAKYELEEVVDFLKNPSKYIKIGAKIPKGVLLVGSPGTGKTLLAKAIAGEADVAYFHMSGSDFVEMFVGVGASRVRDLFEQGRKNAPCILFIDELDAVGRSRGAGYGGGHDEREQTLNQMLVEMDGFNTKEGVIILAATNRPDVLDPALLRPGRFDRQVVISMPDIKEREDILKIHCKNIPVKTDVDLTRIARATPGTSGADLASLVNESALFAARKNKKVVEMEDFEEARDKVLMGIARRSMIISSEEKKMTAYHEAGHTILHYFLKHSDPLHKVTIIPRGRALGMSLSLPEKETYCKSKNWLLDQIKILMGGYQAEKIIYNETTTGTQNDLQRATDLARKMVCEWGMSKLGPVAFGQKEEPIFIGKEIARHKDYSENTARAIDEEVNRIIKICNDDVERIFTEQKDKLILLAETLVKKETLDDEEIRKLLNMENGKEKES